MTIEELIAKVFELSQSMGFWLLSGLETLLNGDWLQLTIGQGVFTIFAGIVALLLIRNFLEGLMTKKPPESKANSNDWTDH